jgi:predicted nucleotidyltransferase
MNIEKIFSTRERVKILESLIFQEGAISVNNLAARLQISKGLVSQYLRMLVQEGVVKRKGSKFIVINSGITKGIKILFNIQTIIRCLRIFKKFKFIEAVGIYGSCAKGENTEKSDVDLWIKIKKAQEADVAFLTTKLHSKVKNLKPLFLTPQKIQKIKKEDPLFYHSLVFGSIIVYGKTDALEL